MDLNIETAEVAEERREKTSWLKNLGGSLRSRRLNFMFFDIQFIHLLLGFENFAKKNTMLQMCSTEKHRELGAAFGRNPKLSHGYSRMKHG